MNYIRAEEEKQLKDEKNTSGQNFGGKTNSLRIITKDVRFVHKMYVRSTPLDFACFMGNFLFFDEGLSVFGFLDELRFCIVNLYHKIHIGGTKKWLS